MILADPRLLGPRGSAVHIPASAPERQRLIIPDVELSAERDTLMLDRYGDDSGDGSGDGSGDTKGAATRWATWSMTTASSRCH